MLQYTCPLLSFILVELNLCLHCSHVKQSSWNILPAPITFSAAYTLLEHLVHLSPPPPITGRLGAAPVGRILDGLTSSDAVVEDAFDDCVWPVVVIGAEETDLPHSPQNLLVWLVALQLLQVPAAGELDESETLIPVWTAWEPIFNPFGPKFFP